MTAHEIDPAWVQGTWSIDTPHSHAGFIVRHYMVANVHGSLSGVAGTIVTGPTASDSSVTATIDATSVTTGFQARDSHIRSPEIFDVERHPQWSFVSTSIRPDGETYLLDGAITIRGVTNPITLTMDAPRFGSAGQPGAAKAGFSARGVISRGDFGIDFNHPLPGGGVTVSDKVRIVLEIEANLVS
ncbi:YceI family protein [Nocardia sp. NPDC050408]|uniref:YceI family protein n=1 Tax=Nocardia sp. NPDC050408 TaxID=3364319 RepID=UPI0037B3AD45